MKESNSERSSALFKYAEFAANLSIVAVAIALAWTVVTRLGAPAKSEDGPVKGARIQLHDVHFENATKSLIFVLNDACSFCKASAPFHRSVAELSRSHGVQTIAIMGTPKEQVLSYLREYSISVAVAAQALPPELGVRAVPTLILVDRSGVVLKTWHGQLTENQQKDVIKSVEEGTS